MAFPGLGCICGTKWAFFHMVLLYGVDMEGWYGMVGMDWMNKGLGISKKVDSWCEVGVGVDLMTCLFIRSC